MTKRDVLSRATKVAFKRARRMGKPVGWAAARKRAEKYCGTMWPDDFPDDWVTRKKPAKETETSAESQA